MRKRSVFRQTSALVMAAALWLAALPWSALATREEDGGYQKLKDPEGLTDGQYVLVDADGYAPFCYDGETGWVTAAEPVLEEDSVADSMDAVWTLTVAEGGVRLQEAAGTFLAPSTDGGNGITEGDYVWSVTWNGDAFSFHGTSGESPVTLARIGDNGYRAVRDELVEAYPEGYPSVFTLYKQSGETNTPEETTQSAEETGTVEPTAETAAQGSTEASADTEPEEPTAGSTGEPTEEPTLPSAEPSALLAAGDYVIWNEEEGTALSSRRASEGSRYYAGTSVKLADGELTGYTSADIWTLAWEGEACILCSGEEVLGTSTDYAGISYGSGDTRWMLEAQEDGWLVKNTASGLYIRYSSEFACWTSGKTAEEATLLRFTAPELAETEEGTEPDTQPQPETGPEETVQSTAGTVTMTPNGGGMLPGTVTLTCEAEGAAIWYAVSADGETYTEYVRYREPIALEAGFGTCYIKAYAQTENALPGEETVCCFTEQTAKGKGLYFGQLHAHSAVSDGTGTVEEAFAYASEVSDLDFLAVTDHSDSFDNALLGSISEDGAAVSEAWAAGKAAAQAATTRDFVAIYGYEMTWSETDRLGHINTFHTPGFQSRDQKAYLDNTMALPNYYDTLTTVSDSISQFNHPGAPYGNFCNFGYYTEARDAVIQLLEVGSGEDAYEYYNQALDQGWHVAPANNQNNHYGQWGDLNESRTVVLADSLTENGIYDAIRSYRVYATEDKDLEITYTLNGYTMGTLLEAEDVGSTVTIQVAVNDPTDGNTCQAEVITEGGAVLDKKLLTDGAASFAISSAYSYYYLRITQPDGDTAVTAPVWIHREEDAGILAFTADDPEPDQGQTVNLTITLFNNENTELDVKRIAFTVDGTLACSTTKITGVSAGGTASCTVPMTWTGQGRAEVTATVTAALAGRERTFTASLVLEYGQEDSQVPLCSIQEARLGETGTVCVIRGYVTAGTSDPYNTFPNTIYLQDETGGIAVTGFTESGVEIGTPLEAEGTIGMEGGNVVLEVLRWKVMDGDRYRYVAESLSLAEAMDVDLHGGELLKIEGEVVSVTPLGSTGVSRFVLEDDAGSRAAVDIDSCIFSGSTGKNELAYVVKTGRTVRASGLLWLSSDGEPALRVRNCDEVVYVPSLPYTAETETGTDNPRTGDAIVPWLTAMPLSLITLFCLKPKKQRK